MQVTSVDGPLSNLCSLYGLVWKVASEAFRLLITAKMHLLCPLKTSETILPTEECMAVAKLHRAREQIANQHTRITLQRSHKSLKLQQRTDKDLSGPVDFGLVASALSAATSCCDNHRSRKVDHTTLRRLVVFPIASAQFWFSSSQNQAAAASAAACVRRDDGCSLSCPCLYSGQICSRKTSPAVGASGRPQDYFLLGTFVQMGASDRRNRRLGKASREVEHFAISSIGCYWNHLVAILHGHHPQKLQLV